MIRLLCLPVALVAIISALPRLAAQAPVDLAWTEWRDVPVQNGGRSKPLDTVAREMLRLVSNRSRMRDPLSGVNLEPTAVYLSMVFDWQGWDRRERDRLLTQMNWGPEYFRLHEPDKWDDAALLRVDQPRLRTMLGMSKDQTHVSATELTRAFVEDPQTGRKVRFLAWTEQLLRRDSQGEALNKVETKALELANHLSSYQNHRMGRGLDILPTKGGESTEGMPLAHLMLTHFDDAADPTGAYRRAQQLIFQARTAYQNHDGQALNQVAAELKGTLRELGEQVGPYPAQPRMRLEVGYNSWAPFRLAWIGMLAAALGLLLHAGSKWKVLSTMAVVAYVLAMVVMVIGFACRILISGRPPVTNMYESIIYVGFGVATFGLLFERIYRQRFILTAAAVVSTVALVLADNSPILLDPSVRPLEPVLRSNFWLMTHVLTITLSYAAFALALGIANITLGYLLVGSANRIAVNALSRFTYKAIQVGVLLLAAGTILGGVWADYSWGRFWGWDPKEVWALVALLGYLCVLHARYAGWVGQRGLAALAVICFSLVVIAWYGVNFVLGAGLHSYGFGAGGQAWVYGAIALQFVYVGAALLRERQPGACETGEFVSHEAPQRHEIANQSAPVT